MNKDSKNNLKWLVKLMRDNGVVKLKTDGFELELSPSAFVDDVEAVPTENKVPEKTYTDEEMLMWSSAGIPEEKMNA